MGASLIATTITFDTVFGSALVGASIILTMHSLARMIFLKRTASKYHLFPVINVAQFVNQFCVFFLITTAFDTISLRAALWLNVVNNVAYFITKPITMYLAYLRCSAVFPAFQKLDWLHFFLIGVRAVELFGIVIVNIIQNELCGGSVAKGTRCENLAIAWTIRDVGAPIFRFYYIICEGIFYYKLFTALREMSHGKNIELIQHRRLQTSLFTVDLLLLIFMSIYRIIGIFNKDLPPYVYIELFSSTLTIFTLTEFGLNIRMLFGSVSDTRGNTGSASGGYHGPNGSQSSKHEMGSIPSSRPRPLTNNSTSPLTSSAADFGNVIEVDVSHSNQHRDYTPYMALGSPTQKHSQPQQQHSDWKRYPYSANDPVTRFYGDDAHHHPLEREKPGQGLKSNSAFSSVTAQSPTVPDRALISPSRSSGRP
ncbi:hypothetical protein BG011_006679 [Mortierella polycephala]|uniref:Uncharacterized protein n=1 Tax=Mortierella polycephala TaxID=41804 RepID=A0A9P6PU56_9FUNG|nr:hypothetical protein BG011_006679 [Mortierella polycephala]